MVNLLRGVIVSTLAIIGLSVPALAGGNLARSHSGTTGKASHPHVATSRFSANQSGSESDPVLLLLFGSGLMGCASLCVVQSHREEKRRSTQQTTGTLVRWESA